MMKSRFLKIALPVLLLVACSALVASDHMASRQLVKEGAILPLETILEYVTLSDLARLGAVRSVRARLYYQAGLTPEIIATWEPEDLHLMLKEFVANSGFDGIAPLPKEVHNLVSAARSLPQVVQY